MRYSDIGLVCKVAKIIFEGTFFVIRIFAFKVRPSQCTSSFN